MWLSECPPAIGALLASASHLPLLVDLVTGRLGGGDPLVSGLGAVLLGVCLLHAPQNRQAAGSGHGGAADTVLDVVMSRVGLSVFFARLDELRRVPAFVAASAAPKLPKPVTRAAAAAAVAGDVGAGDAEGDSPSSGQTGAPANDGVPAALPLGPAASSSAAEAERDAVAPVFDYAFTQFVGKVEGEVKAKVMEVFARPAAGPGSSGVSGAVDSV